MSDLFHELVPDDFIADVFDVMVRAQQHIFQVLTKRPERMAALMPMIWHSWGDRVAPNVWLGTSIENRRFVHRAELLRLTPAAVRWISAEPLLGPLVHNAVALDRETETDIGCWDDTRRADDDDCFPAAAVPPELDLTGIDWLVAGGESGKGHRPLDLEWMRDLRDACAEWETAFFVKQLGGHRPGDRLEDLPEDLRIREYPPQARAAAGV